MAIWNHFEDPIMALDTEQRVIGINRQALELIGRTSTECIGRPCYVAVPGIDQLSGRPCAEDCPVFRTRTHDWAHIRRLRLEAETDQTPRLECLLLRCVDSGEDLTLAVLKDPEHTPVWDEPSAIELAQEMLPALLGLATRERAAELMLELAVARTGAMAGEIRISHSITDELEKQSPIATVHARDGLKHHGVVAEDLHAQVARAARPAIRANEAPASEPAKPTQPQMFLCVPILGLDRVAATVFLAFGDLPPRVGRVIRILFPLSIQFGSYLHRAIGDETAVQSREGKSLRIRALGGFDVEAEGERVPPGAFKRRGALEILKRLVATPHWRARRSELAFGLWPEQEEEAASVNLRVVLHALKRGLEPDLEPGQPSRFLDITSDTVGLRRDSVSTDVDEVLACHRRASELVSHGNNAEAARVATRAVALYRGPFLGDEDSSDWGLAQRARLHEVYLDTVSLLGRLLRVSGRHEAAIRLFQEALLTEPAREELHRALIQAYSQAGRSQDALAQFDRCVKVLRQEVGVDPTPETAAAAKESQAVLGKRRARPRSTVV